jgi:large subunit ribosomal protein L22
LAFSRKASGKIVNKLLKSALANADQLGTIDVDRLFIKRIFVDEGPTMKRFRPRAMGRATRIRKRTSHITVILDEE